MGMTGIPPQIYQAQLGRMSATLLQYLFKGRDRMKLGSYQIYTQLQFGIVPQQLRGDMRRRRRCREKRGWVDPYHIAICLRRGSLCAQHNCMRNVLADLLKEYCNSVTIEERLPDSNLRPGDLAASVSQVFRILNKNTITNEQNK